MRIRQLKWLPLLAIAIIAVLSVTACGSSSNNSNSESSTNEGSETSTNASGDAEASESSGSTIVPEPPLTPTTSIRMTKQLQKKPPAGKTVAIVTGTLPQYALFAEEVEAAAAALGWTSKQFTYTTDQEQALSQAISAKPDFIYAQSLTKEGVKAGLAAAKAAGIPVVNAGASGESDPGADYYVTISRGTDYTTSMTDWIINNSDGKANVALLNIPEFELFKENEQIMSKRFAEKCPECSFASIKVTLAELSGGQVASTAVSYLQTHPEVEYLVAAFSELMPNLVPTLKSVGLDEGLTIAGIGADQAVTSEIAEGSVGPFTVSGKGTVGWQAVDVMARLSVGEDISQLVETPAVLEAASVPWLLIDPKQAKKDVKFPYGWPGPPNYKQEFEGLWNVGS